MKITGIISSLGGFNYIRGSAKLKDLALLSKADDFQRDLMEDHIKELREFYRKQKELFFPEVVLSYTLKYDFTTGISGVDPINDIVLKKIEFVSNVDEIKIKTLKTEIGNQRIVEVIINDDWLSANHPFSRIDGNHRINAFLKENEHKSFDEFLAPFCLILFSDNDKSERSKKIIFHNINSKARPLTSEEELKSILDDELNFPDHELQSNLSFGWSYYFARKLHNQVDLVQLRNIKISIIQRDRAFWQETTELLLSKKSIKKQKNEISNIIDAVIQINSIYSLPQLMNSKNQGLLGAFIYYQLISKHKTNIFKKWVLKNQIYELEKLKTKEYVKLFDKILESKKKTIFVSMEFSDPALPNYEAIKNAVNDINKECKLKLKLRQIRIDKFKTGYSYQINTEILKLIEECGLFIADLTLGNKNVYHEIGYLMGLNKGWGFPHENFILLHNSSIGNTKSDIGFNLVGIKQLRVSDTNTLREQVKRQIKIYYGL